MQTVRRWYLVSVLLTVLAGLPAVSASGPNIVIILADDMGYGDVRALNPSSRIATPHLDRLAAEGMTFTDAHSPSAVCTPTRYGLVTGRYCWRSRLKRGVLNGYGSPLIERDRATIASVLRTEGYRCGIVGKWHLGLGFGRKGEGKELDYAKPVQGGPSDLGFHFSHIIPASLDFPPYVYIRDGQVTQRPSLTQAAQKFPPYLRRGPRAPSLVMADCLDDLLQEAVGYIRREAKSAENPFFLYFPLTAPHKPVLPHRRFRGKSGLGPYGDFVVQVDWTVGQVVKAIDESGIKNDTVIFYSSDNGSFMRRREDATAEDHLSDETIQAYRSDHHTANHVFRGTKADIWEAGHRVPFFARWPGRIKAGSQCAETICLTDLFATAAELAGVPLAEGVGQDSFSIVQLLDGKSWQKPRPPVIHHSAAGMFAIRDGKWKLVLGNGSGGRDKPAGKAFAKPYRLFDMEKDPSEGEDVAESNTDVVSVLERKCRIIREGRIP